ncbi:MAG: alpha-amylase family glycosyl hydrolase [Sphingopyxis sp.]
MIARSTLIALLGAAAVLSGCAMARAQVPSAPVPLSSVRDRLPEDEIIYLVMPDRFDNGDTTNDTGGIAGGPLQTGFDPTHKGFYHGGDLAGLTQRLDYIQGLGVTAIWFTPIFVNRPVQGDPGAPEGQLSAGYHGYWATDFTTIDPHLGTEAEFRAFVDAAHARGMKVYMDIVTNHTADVIRMAECPNSACPYRSIADYPDHAYTPVVPAGEAGVKVPAWLNDPQYYHNRGNTTFRGESSTMGDFVGLDDLATENPRVVSGFIDIYASWIDRFGIDGFRIDTAQHVNPEFWQAFVPAIEARARAAGIPNFHIFGEVFNEDRDVARQAYWTHAAALPSLLDYAVARTIDEVAGAAGPTDAFEVTFRGDILYAGGVDRARQMPIFHGNYDAGRFGHFMDVANPRASDAERLARAELANAMLMTMRGVPTIYAGDEQGFTGDGNDQNARQDMFASQVASYNDDRLIGTEATTATANFVTTHPLYQQIATLAAIRRSHPALTRGRQIVRNAGPTPGLLAISRIDPVTGREVVAVFNTSSSAQSGNIIVDRATMRFTALAGHCPATVRVAGSAAITLPAFGYMICAAEPNA